MPAATHPAIHCLTPRKQTPAEGAATEIRRWHQVNCTRIERELSAYLDGELQGARRDQVERHLADCERCRAVLARLRQTARLVAAMPEVAPPASIAARVFAQVAPASAAALTCAEAAEQVHAYADGWLSQAEVARLESHLRDCPECEAELRRVRAIKHAAASVPEVAPPASVRESVMAAVSARQARAQHRLRPWAWAAMGTAAAGAAVWLATLMAPHPAPNSKPAVATRPVAPPVAREIVPAPVTGPEESAGETVERPPSFMERVAHHLRRSAEPQPADRRDTIAVAPVAPKPDVAPKPAGDGTTTPDGTGATPPVADRPPDTPVEPVVTVVAVVPPPDTPETDAWEAVGVTVATPVKRGEDTVAAAEPRELFRLSRPVQYKEVTIRASGHDRKGRPMRGSDGGYVAVINTPL
jgi:anti-sigma factor RsiW